MNNSAGNDDQALQAEFESACIRLTADQSRMVAEIVTRADRLEASRLQQQFEAAGIRLSAEQTRTVTNIVCDGFSFSRTVVRPSVTGKWPCLTPTPR